MYDLFVLGANFIIYEKIKILQCVFNRYILFTHRLNASWSFVFCNISLYILRKTYNVPD